MVTKEQVLGAIVKPLVLVLITLRACNVIDWAWYLILAPYMFATVLVIVFSICKTQKEHRQKKIDAAVLVILESRKRGETITHLSDCFNESEFYEIMQKVNSKIENGGIYDNQTNID